MRSVVFRKRKTKNHAHTLFYLCVLAPVFNSIYHFRRYSFDRNSVLFDSWLWHLKSTFDCPRVLSVHVQLGFGTVLALKKRTNTHVNMSVKCNQICSNKMFLLKLFCFHICARRILPYLTVVYYFLNILNVRQFIFIENRCLRHVWTIEDKTRIERTIWPFFLKINLALYLMFSKNQLRASYY